MNKTLKSILLLIILLFTLSGCTTQAPSDEDKNNEGGNTPNPNATEVVVYFSCTSTTKNIAEKIGNLKSIPVIEILPKVPYTADDLKYYTNCRADKEYADPTSRPEIAENIDISKYDVIYLGYPIWYGEAPRIISTFLESYDFEEKTIVPFCTSASSGIGSSDKKLQSLISGATWKTGASFYKNTSNQEISKWLDEVK